MPTNPAHRRTTQSSSSAALFKRTTSTQLFNVLLNHTAWGIHYRSAMVNCLCHCQTDEPEGACACLAAALIAEKRLSSRTCPCHRGTGGSVTVTVIKSCQMVLCEAERQHLAWWMHFPMRLLEVHARALSSMRHSKVTIRAHVGLGLALTVTVT